jgi:predicted site-specific integrase-resolvase
MTTPATEDPHFTRQDVAALRRVSVRQVDRWIKSGQLAVIRRGKRQTRITPEALAAFDELSAAGRVGSAQAENAA